MADTELPKQDEDVLIFSEDSGEVLRDFQQGKHYNRGISSPGMCRIALRVEQKGEEQDWRQKAGRGSPFQ